MMSATLSVAEAANMLGVSRRSLYNYCASGDFPCVRIGKRILIRRTDLEFLHDKGMGTPVRNHPEAHSE